MTNLEVKIEVHCSTDGDGLILDFVWRFPAVDDVLRRTPGGNPVSYGTTQLHNRREMVQNLQIGPLRVERGTRVVERQVELPVEGEIEHGITSRHKKIGDARPELQRLMAVVGVV